MRIGQKYLGQAAKIGSKVAEVGTKVLNAAEDATGGAIDVAPGFGVAKMAVKRIDIASKAASGLSQAGNLDAGLHSLSSAYKDFKAPGTPEDPAPGAEGVQTAANDA